MGHGCQVAVKSQAVSRVVDPVPEAWPFAQQCFVSGFGRGALE